MKIMDLYNDGSVTVRAEQDCVRVCIEYEAGGASIALDMPAVSKLISDLKIAVKSQ